MNGNQGNDFLAGAVLLTAVRRARQEMHAALEPGAPAREETAVRARRWHLLGPRPLVSRFGSFLLIAHVARLRWPRTLPTR